MRISKLLKFLLLVLPFVEIAGFIIVGKWIGVLPTILLIIMTTIVGFVVLRVQGFVNLVQMQKRMQAGEHPSRDILNNTLMMLGGALLIIPGFITDIVGILLLFPTIRVLMFHWLTKVGVLKAGRTKQGKRPSSQGRVIEGEFQREKNKK